MFGKNKIVKQDLTGDGQFVNVHSLFETIQGEGPFAGRPAYFIRLANCNLRCTYCDTEFQKGAIMHDIFDLVPNLLEAKSPLTGLVVITGGEPFIQNIEPLVRLLTIANMQVQIETNGTLWIPGFEEVLGQGGVTIVVSPKTGSINKNLIPYVTAYKYILEAEGVDEHDGLPIKPTQPNVDGNIILARPPEGFLTAGIYVQACDTSYDNAARRANYRVVIDSAIKYNYSISFQMHKFLGVE